jgi:uncharacterized damage-inducible protein DinB
MSTAPQASISAEFAMTYRDLLCDRIEFDLNSTKRAIAAIPEAKKDYKPEPNSRSAWDLAVHICTSDTWFLNGIVNHSFDFSGEPPAPASSVAELAPIYDKNVKAALAKIRVMTPQQLTTPVNFFGIMHLPAALYLQLAHEHTVHHRGQLTTYLRPIGAKVPDIYGGSFDEPFQG